VGALNQIATPDHQINLTINPASLFSDTPAPGAADVHRRSVPGGDAIALILGQCRMHQWMKTGLGTERKRGFRTLV
jgi:hypothetical protein